MKIAFGVGALVLMGTVSASAGNFAGQYQVAGKNVDGSAYTGTAEIVATSDTTCKMSWQTGGTTSQGICMRNGEQLRCELCARRCHRARALPDQA